MPAAPAAGAPVWRAHAAMLGTILTWSAAFAWIKVALEDLTPLDVALTRWIVAGIPFAVVLMITGVPKFSRREWPRVVLVSVLTVTGYHLALNYGETGITAGVAALIVATGPVWTALLSVVMLGERFTPRKGIGLLVAIGGVIVLILGRGDDLTVHYLGRALIAFAAPVMWAVASVVSKPLLKDRNPLTFTALTSLVGTVPLLFVAATGTVPRVMDASALVLFGVVFLGVLSTFAGNSGFYYALGSLTPIQTMTYVYLNPLFAIGWSAALTGERLTLILLAGAALVIAGVALTNWPARRAVAPQAPSGGSAVSPPDARDRK